MISTRISLTASSTGWLRARQSNAPALAVQTTSAAAHKSRSRRRGVAAGADEYADSLGIIPRERTVRRGHRPVDVSESFSRHRRSSRRTPSGGTRRQARPVRLAAHDRRDDFSRIGAGERTCAGKHLEEDASPGPDVGAACQQEARAPVRDSYTTRCPRSRPLGSSPGW